MQNHTDGGGSSRATKKRVREVDDTQKENGGVSGSLRWDHVLMLASMQQEKVAILAICAYCIPDGVVSSREC